MVPDGMVIKKREDRHQTTKKVGKLDCNNPSNDTASGDRSSSGNVGRVVFNDEGLYRCGFSYCSKERFHGCGGGVIHGRSTAHGLSVRR